MIYNRGCCFPEAWYVLDSQGIMSFVNVISKVVSYQEYDGCFVDIIVYLGLI